MTQSKKTSRPGAMAIAVVLALSSTPLLAQPAASNPPVVTLPTPAPPTRAPVATLPTPAAPVQRVTVPEVAPVAAAQTPRAERPAAPVRARAATTSQRSATAPAPVAPAPAEPAPAPFLPPESTMTEAPAPAALPPVTTGTDPVQASPASAEAGNDVLPIAGGALGLAVLAGGAYALARRRRRDEGDQEAYEISDSWEQDHAMQVVTAPDHASIPVAAPVRPSVAAAAVPAGVDIATLGRHTRAAYEGPTQDNPSLSLKRRLKRAAFFDQREAMTREAGEAPTPVANRADAAIETGSAPRRDSVVTSRRVSPKASTQALFGGFRPAFQG